MRAWRFFPWRNTLTVSDGSQRAHRSPLEAAKTVVADERAAAVIRLEQAQQDLSYQKFRLQGAEDAGLADCKASGSALTYRQLIEFDIERAAQRVEDATEALQVLHYLGGAQ